MYLVAILDLFSRTVLSWRLSNSIDLSFCVSALKEALETYGVPALIIPPNSCTNAVERKRAGDEPRV